ncbi:hypothetical protein VTO73DRAFT_12151 [Trametes versicolor]
MAFCETAICPHHVLTAWHVHAGRYCVALLLGFLGDSRSLTIYEHRQIHAAARRMSLSLIAEATSRTMLNHARAIARATPGIRSLRRSRVFPTVIVAERPGDVMRGASKAGCAAHRPSMRLTPVHGRCDKLVVDRGPSARAARRSCEHLFKRQLERRRSCGHIPVLARPRTVQDTIS